MARAPRPLLLEACLCERGSDLHYPSRPPAPTTDVHGRDQAVAHGVPPGPGDALTEEPIQGLGNAIPMVDGADSDPRPPQRPLAASGGHLRTPQSPEALAAASGHTPAGGDARDATEYLAMPRAVAPVFRYTAVHMDCWPATQCALRL